MATTKKAAKKKGVTDFRQAEVKEDFKAVSNEKARTILMSAALWKQVEDHAVRKKLSVNRQVEWILEAYYVDAEVRKAVREYEARVEEGGHKHPGYSASASGPGENISFEDLGNEGAILFDDDEISTEQLKDIDKSKRASKKRAKSSS